MDLLDVLYTVMILILSACIFLVLREANNQNWSRLAKWLSLRMCVVFSCVMVAIIAVKHFSDRTDLFQESMLCLGMTSMCILLVMHMPDILKNMSNKELAEDLNIREPNQAEDEPADESRE